LAYNQKTQFKKWAKNGCFLKPYFDFKKGLKNGPALSFFYYLTSGRHGTTLHKWAKSGALFGLHVSLCGQKGLKNGTVSIERLFFKLSVGFDKYLMW